MLARNTGIGLGFGQRGLRIAPGALGIDRLDLELGDLLVGARPRLHLLRLEIADAGCRRAAVDAQHHITAAHALALGDETAQHDRRGIARRRQQGLRAMRVDLAAEDGRTLGGVQRSRLQHQRTQSRFDGTQA